MELQLQNLTKQYGKKCAVNNVSADLVPGIYGLQIVWILVFLALHVLLYGLARRNLTIAGG